MIGDGNEWVQRLKEAKTNEDPSFWCINRMRDSCSWSRRWGLMLLHQKRQLKLWNNMPVTMDIVIRLYESIIYIYGVKTNRRLVFIVILRVRWKMGQWKHWNNTLSCRMYIFIERIRDSTHFPKLKIIWCRNIRDHQSEFGYTKGRSILLDWDGIDLFVRSRRRWNPWWRDDDLLPETSITSGWHQIRFLYHALKETG